MYFEISKGKAIFVGDKERREKLNQQQYIEYWYLPPDGFIKQLCVFKTIFFIFQYQDTNI